MFGKERKSHDSSVGVVFGLLGSGQWSWEHGVWSLGFAVEVQGVALVTGGKILMKCSRHIVYVFVELYGGRALCVSHFSI